MTEKMKAARFYRAGEPLRVDRISVPKLGPEDVLVEIKACGICGSDIHIVFEGVTPAGYTPITLGHEPSGLVFGIGSEVKGWKIGDRVSIHPFLTCGKCINCLSSVLTVQPRQRFRMLLTLLPMASWIFQVPFHRGFLWRKSIRDWSISIKKLATPFAL